MKITLTQFRSAKVCLIFAAITLFIAGSTLSLGMPIFSTASSSSAKSSMVLTPYGYAPSACVHLIGSGASLKAIGGSVVVTYSDGKTTTFGACSQKLPTHPTYAYGWVEYGLAVTSPTKQESAKWLVPKAPTSKDGQTIFMFPATQNCDTNGCGAFIIQPVLQWGPSAGGGGTYWTFASWYVGSFGYYVSNLITVSTGDHLVGRINSNHCNSGYTCNWVITSKDVTTGQTSVLKENSLAKQVDDFVTLEVYGITSCSDYPASGSTTFTAIHVNHGTLSSGDWSPVVAQNDGCGEKVTINSGSSITLSY